MTSLDSDCRKWLYDGRKIKDITHLLVVQDTWDIPNYSFFPVYVRTGESAREVAKKYEANEHLRVRRCYSYSLDLQKQLTCMIPPRNFD